MQRSVLKISIFSAIVFSFTLHASNPKEEEELLEKQPLNQNNQMTIDCLIKLEKNGESNTFLPQIDSQKTQLLIKSKLHHSTTYPLCRGDDYLVFTLSVGSTNAEKVDPKNFISNSIYPTNCQMIEAFLYRCAQSMDSQFQIPQNVELTHFEKTLVDFFHNTNPQMCFEKLTPHREDYQQIILKKFEEAKKRDEQENLILKKFLEIKEIDYKMQIDLGKKGNRALMATLSIQVSKDPFSLNNKTGNIINEGVHQALSPSLSNFPTLAKKLTNWCEDVFPIENLKDSKPQNSQLSGFSWKN